MKGDVRIDKYLWMVRLFKTRSKASEACRKGRVKINGQGVKPAQDVKTGDELEVKYTPIWRHYRVLGFPRSRIKAALVPEFLSEHTPEEEIERLQEYLAAQRSQFMYSPSKGRPTKKERREIDKFKRGN